MPLEEQVQALRDHALGQELLLRVLLAAVEKLGVDFVWPDEGGRDSERDVSKLSPKPRVEESGDRARRR